MDQNILEILASKPVAMLEEGEKMQLNAWEKQYVENEQLYDLLQFIEVESGHLEAYRDFEKPTPFKQTTTAYQSIIWLGLIGILLSLSAYIWFSSNNTQTYQVALLEDNSEIYLMNGASYELLENFNSSSRELRLNGSAFFDIAHDDSKPFIIHHDLGKIEVLGTSFQVENKGNSIHVIVRDGKVKLTHSNNDIIYLTEGESYQFMDKSFAKTNATNYWKFLFSGVYENEDIKSIILELAKVHNLSVFMDQSFLDTSCRYNGEFKNASVNEVLKEFNLLFDLQFEIINNELKLLNTACE